MTESPEKPNVKRSEVAYVMDFARMIAREQNIPLLDAVHELKYRNLAGIVSGQLDDETERQKRLNKDFFKACDLVIKRLEKLHKNKSS